MCADEPVRVCVNDLAHHEADVRIGLVCCVVFAYGCTVRAGD